MPDDGPLPAAVSEVRDKQLLMSYVPFETRAHIVTGQHSGRRETGNVITFLMGISHLVRKANTDARQTHAHSERGTAHQRIKATLGGRRLWDGPPALTHHTQRTRPSSLQSLHKYRLTLCPPQPLSSCSFIWTWTAR